MTDDFIPPIGQAQTGSIPNAGWMPIAGCAAALLLALFANRAARKHNFYAAEVYGMTPGSHRRFAAACLLFAAAFGLSARFELLTIPLWGAFLTAGILYGASFVRGFGESDR